MKQLLKNLAIIPSTESMQLRIRDFVLTRYKKDVLLTYITGIRQKKSIASRARRCDNIKASLPSVVIINERVSAQRVT